MHLSWVMCLLKLTLIVLCRRSTACQSNSTPYQPLTLTSLQCYNDYFDSRIERNYTPLISCSWRERWRSHTHSPLDLRYENRLPFTPCEVQNSSSSSSSSSVSDGEQTVSCVYDASHMGFTIGAYYSLTFYNPQNTTPTTLTGPLSQHMHVKTPQNLRVEPQQAGGHQLTWESPYPSSSRLTSDLHYQVIYGTDGLEWMTLNTSGTTLHIKGETLLPGRLYKAKVRARANQWQWSQWSPLVEWSTEEEVGPSDFSCVIDSVSMVTCSWKLKREHAQFLSYSLTCRHLSNKTEVKCCPSPVLSSGSDVEMLEFSCSLCVSDPADLRVELTPTPVSKTFASWQYIQPPAPLRFRREWDRHGLVLRWARPGVGRNAPLRYQLRYKPKERGEWKTLSLQSSSLYQHLSVTQLLPDTLYVAQVQTVVDEENKYYGGIPSAWSAAVEWTTPPAGISLATILYVAVAVVVVVIFIVMVITLPKCQKKIHDWKLSIPSPTESKVLSEMIKRKASWLYVVTEKEKLSTCVVQDPEDIRSRLPSSCKERMWSSIDEDCDSASLHLLTYKTTSPSTTTTGGRCCTAPLDSSGLSFDGPYIYCLKESDLKLPEGDKGRCCGSFPDLPSPCSSSSPPPSPSSSSSSPSSSQVLMSPVSDVSFLSSLSEVPGGYVATLQMSVPVQGADSPSALAAAVAQGGNKDAHLPPPSPPPVPSSGLQSLPAEPPPAYTRQPPALHTVVLPRPSGYCSLPSLDFSGWAASSSSPPPAPGASGEVPSAAVASLQTCPQPPGGELEWRDAADAGRHGDETRTYVQLKTGYTTNQSDFREQELSVFDRATT